MQIIPGTGGSFYCENCVRDGSLVRALRQEGHEVTMVPMYLPLSFDDQDIDQGTPLFFGAISTYLIEKIPGLIKLPDWFRKTLDSRPLLKFAARKADSTRAAGLEGMTLSMLRGEQGNQADEIRHLVEWIKTEVKPDVVYLSNILLTGLAQSLKETLNVPIVCALEDEDIWLQDMESESLERIWKVIEEQANFVDMYLPVSDYYNRKIQKLLKIPPEKLRTVHIGIDLEGYEDIPEKPQPPTIGYLSRMCEGLGLGILVDAFILLKTDPQFKNLRLRATGGVTRDDEAFITSLKTQLLESDCLDDVEFMDGFDRDSRIEFLKSLSILSVPMTKDEAFGVFLLEALVCGVPIVQPNIGAFPEVIELTDGGVCYEPNSSEKLAETLKALLLDRDRLDNLGATGRQKVLSYFSSSEMAKRMIEVFEYAIET